jgi:peptidoglycan/LPS O-acetylase OafA/YrhL
MPCEPWGEPRERAPRAGAAATSQQADPAHATPLPTSRLIHLDMLRGLAALAVVVGHVRGVVLVDFGDVAAPGIATKALYFMTGLGHQAVLAFFALSGFLVGGRALQAMREGRWSPASYIVARLSRLWTVVVPALLLTLGLDLLGSALGGAEGYAGSYHHQLSSGPRPGEPVDHSIPVLLANIAFLQTIAAPVYGSNGPLWSLAYEFWYYVVGPLLAAAILVEASLARRLALAAAALALTLALPHHISLLGAVWIAGALAHAALWHPGLRATVSTRGYLLAAAAGAATILLLGFSQPGVAWAIGLGLAFALLLPALAALPSPGRLYASLAHGLSEISYTLYAVHFPIFLFIYFVLVAPRQYQPDAAGLALVAALLTLGVAGAAGSWWCFERNTPTVRAALLSLAARASGWSKPAVDGTRAP